jgi:hypothetical protein
MTENSPIQLTAEDTSAVAQQISDEIQQSERDRASLLTTITKYRELFLAKDDRAVADKPWPHSCSLVPPTLKQSKNALLAHHVPALLGPEPIFHLEGDGTADKSMQAEGDQFFDRQLRKQIKYKKAMHSIFDSSFTDGVCFGVVGFKEEWKYTQQWQVTAEVQLDPETGEPVTSNQQVRKAGRVKVPIYDGPVVIPMPVERIGTFPAANSDLQASPGLYIKWYLTRADLGQMKESGLFDDVAITKLLATAPDGDPLMPTDTERGIKSTPNTMATGPGQGWWVTECYWLRNTKENEPPEDWRIFIHELTCNILSAQPTPWFSGKRPVFACRPFADRYGIYGDSLANLQGDIQRAEAALLQLTIDSSAMQVDPQILTTDSAVNKKDLQAIAAKKGPGSIKILSEEAIKSTQKWITGTLPTILLPVWEKITKMGQLAIGVDDSGLGIQPPTDTTATATADLIEGRQKLVNLQQEGLVEAMVESAELIWEMDYQFQGHDSLQKIFFDANPESQLTLQDVLDGKYSFVVSGASGGGNQMVRAKRSEERYMFLSQDPVISSNPELMYQLKTDFLREHGTRDPEIYLGRKEDYVMSSQQLMMQQQQMQQEQMMLEAQGQKPPQNKG